VLGAGCFGDTSKTSGADVLARLYFLEGNGQLDSSTTNGILSNIISYGYTVATVQCTQAFVDEQVYDFECTDTAYGAAVLASANCQACISSANAVAAARTQLDKDAHALNPNYVIPTLDPGISSAYFGAVSPADGICAYVCEQCVLANTNQTIQMQLVADCSVETDEFRTAFTSAMSLQAETELTQHQAGLTNTGVEIQKADDIRNMSIQLADTIQQMTSVKQLNALKQNALNIQSMTITAGSKSVVIQNASQSISASMMTSLVSRVYNDTAVQNSIDYSQKQQTIQVETNFNDLVQSLSVTVNTMNKLLMNTLGKMIIVIVCILLLIALVFAAIFYFKPDLLFGSASSAVLGF